MSVGDHFEPSDVTDPTALARLERALAGRSDALTAPFLQEWGADAGTGGTGRHARAYVLAFGRGPDGWGFVVHCYGVRPHRLVRTTMLRDAPRAVRLAAALVVPRLVRALLRG